MKRALVTGATGFIGRHTIEPLLECGFEVDCVTSRPPQPGLAGRWHQADLLDPRAVKGLLETIRPTHLLHLAWAVEPGAFWTHSDNLRWLAASIELFRLFGSAGGERIVAAGTCAEYRWAEEDLREDSPVSPSTLYGVAKDALRRVGEEFGRQEGIQFAWGRIFFLYGPRETPGRLVSGVARSLARGVRAETSSGDQLRDYLHVEDAAQAFVELLDSFIEGPVNVASGRATRVRDIIETLGRISGREDLLAIGALGDRPGDPARICGVVTRLQEELGWFPKYDLESGLRSSFDWWDEMLNGAHG